MSAKGHSLELYFIDGKPDGMLTAEVFNWTGHVLMFPRTQIKTALARKEAHYTGVYLLIGEQNGEQRAYIGEAEDIGDRMRTHDTLKDWWTTAVLVASTANNLNKAHVRYLEARLVEEASNAGRVMLENKNTPTRAGLSEAAETDMEVFLDYLLMVLPAIRIDIFLRNTRPSTQKAKMVEAVATPIFELVTKKHGLQATAILEDGEFIVQAGSFARSAWAGKGSENSAYGQLYAQLVKMGILQERGELRVFEDNYAFKSPSAAATVVNGRPSNGTIEWKVMGQSKTYKQWEAEQIARRTDEEAA